MNEQNKIIVIGCSSGGLDALQVVLKPLPADFPYAIIIVQHLARNGEHLFIDVLNSTLSLPVQEAVAEEKPLGGHIYIAPGDYHLLFEKDGSFNVSMDEKVIGSRPSIDVLFETAAESLSDNLIAIILTGNSNDGADGIEKAHKSGATVIIQDPKSAAFPVMPSAAAEKINSDKLYKLEKIAEYLNEMGRV